MMKKTLYLILLPAMLWGGLVFSRPYLISSHCLKGVNLCSKESVPTLDRLAISFDDNEADRYSDLGQNLSGVMAFTLPHVWTGVRVLMGVLSPSVALSVVAVDTLVVAQAVAWNGMLTEIVHILTQRPRPFVYSDPQQKGITASNYTSFYSGHTSFAAATGLTAFLVLAARNAPWFLLIFSMASAEILTFSTGYLRILAGRHFLTDVLVGMLAGSLVAWWIVKRAPKVSSKALQ